MNVINSYSEAGYEPLCIDFLDSFKLINSVGESPSSGIRFEVFDCNEDFSAPLYSMYKNPEAIVNKKCSPPALEETSTIYLGVNYINSYIDSLDCKHPIKFYHKGIMETLERGLFKLTKFSLLDDVLVSDNGWILESIYETHIPTIKTISRDTFQSNFRERVKIDFDSQKIRNKTKRQYLKVQELFAKIGGLFNAFSMIIHVILFDYIRFKFRVYYSKFIFEGFNESQLSKTFCKSYNDLLAESNKHININNNNHNLNILNAQLNQGLAKNKKVNNYLRQDEEIKEQRNPKLNYNSPIRNQRKINSEMNLKKKLEYSNEPEKFDEKKDRNELNEIELIPQFRKKNQESNISYESDAQLKRKSNLGLKLNEEIANESKQEREKNEKLEIQKKVSMKLIKKAKSSLGKIN